jgi:hypothetical protein
MTISGNLTQYVSSGNVYGRILHLQSSVSSHHLYLDNINLTQVPDLGPSFSNVFRSNETAGASCTFSATVYDVPEPGLSHWIFSTNNTGVWVNDTATAFINGSIESISVTKTLNDTVGNIVQWLFYANCTDGEATSTSIRQITLQAPEVTPTPTPTVTPTATPVPTTGTVPTTLIWIILWVTLLIIGIALLIAGKTQYSVFILSASAFVGVFFGLTMYLTSSDLSLAFIIINIIIFVLGILSYEGAKE